MNFGYDSLIGICAAFLTTLSFVPQIIKANHTRRMKDVSRYLMVLFTTGSILWIIYGILHEDLVIIGANATAATFNLILLYYSFAYAVPTWELISVDLLLHLVIPCLTDGTSCRDLDVPIKIEETPFIWNNHIFIFIVISPVLVTNSCTLSTYRE